MKKFKILFAFVTFAFLFFAWSSPVYALEIPPYGGPTPNDIDESIYKYRATGVASHGTSSSHKKYIFYEFGYSTTPLYYDNTVKGLKPTDKGLLYRCTIYYYYELGTYSDLSVMHYDVNGALFVDELIQSSNHEIKDASGNVVFRAPLLTAQTVKPLEEVTLKNQAVIIGGTICLVVLGICLAVLPRRFYQFLN